jgi:twitching motility protein PilJ
MARTESKPLFSFRQLSVWQKCALIAVPFLLPIALLLVTVISQNNDNIGIVKAEVRGMEYLRPVKNLVQQLGLHRGYNARYNLGDKSVEADRTKAANTIDELIREVDAVDAKHGAEFKTTEKWATAKEAWKAVRANLTAENVTQLHTDVIAKVLDISVDVWEYSTLALDPVAESYYLQDMMYARVLNSMEDVGQLRVLATTALLKAKNETKSPFSYDEKVRVNVLLGAVESAKAAYEKEAKNAARADASLKGKTEPLAEDFKTKADAFNVKLNALLQDDVANRPTAAELYNTGTEAITALSKMYEAYDPLLAGLLEKRAGGYTKSNLIAVAGTIVGLLLVFVAAMFVTRGITGQLSNLNTLFEKIEAGDYQTRAKVTSGDEIGKLTGSINNTLDRTLTLIQSADEKNSIQTSIMKLLDEVGGVADGDLTKDAEVSADMTGAIADSFNYMIEQLRSIIGNVQKATQQVSTAANRIQTSAESLATGSESQSAQIFQTSTAIEQMAESIQQVSENANVSSTVAQQALTTAKQGNTAVRNTIDGMNRIREQAQETSKRIKRLGETSQEIGQIVQLIDDIADRTSILALNASIQAAAAGEAGRGFAVVAEEVERLAVRSTEATKKIAALVKAIQGETNEAVAAMDRSIQEVVNGSKVANQAGQSLQEIEGVSVKLAELIQQISSASKTQAQSSEELSRSMGNISQITVETANGTKQTAQSVSNLAKLADELRSSVSTFRLPQGQNASDSARYNVAQ